LWGAIDSFCEWRLRITGTRAAFITTGILSSESGDYPNDPRHSTLYFWWVKNAKIIDNLTEKVDSIESQIKSS